MRVYLQESRCQSSTPRAIARNRRQSICPEQWQKSVMKSVKRWHEDRQSAIAEERLEPLPASPQFVYDFRCDSLFGIFTRMAAELLAGHMVYMAPAMLQNRDPWLIAQSVRQCGFDQAGDNGERDRKLTGNAEQTVKLSRGRDRIIITPPQRGAPARPYPRVKFVREIGPIGVSLHYDRPKRIAAPAPFPKRVAALTLTRREINKASKWLQSYRNPDNNETERLSTCKGRGTMLRS